MTRHAMFWSTTAVVSLSAATAALAGCGRAPRCDDVAVETPVSQAAQQQKKSVAQSWPLLALCPKASSGEHGGPQGRLIRGGCLENFTFIVAEKNGKRIVPPDTLPDIVHGWNDSVGQSVELHLETHKNDTCIKDAAGRSIDAPPLYDVWVTTADQGKYNLCSGARYEPGAPRCPGEAGDLEGKAIAVPGHWEETRARHVLDVQGQPVVTLACISGAAAKCVHWGYVPWVTYSPASGGSPTKLDGHHEACVRAARAQYFDRDESFTCNNAFLDTFDKLGIRLPESGAGKAPGQLGFEAAWGAEKLVCLTRPRYDGCDEEVLVNIDAQGLRCRQEYTPQDSWPEGALVMTRSTVGKKPPSKLCPTRAPLCESTPGGVSKPAQPL